MDAGGHGRPGDVSSSYAIASSPGTNRARSLIFTHVFYGVGHRDPRGARPGARSTGPTQSPAPAHGDPVGGVGCRVRRCPPVHRDRRMGPGWTGGSAGRLGVEGSATVGIDDPPHPRPHRRSGVGPGHRDLDVAAHQHDRRPTGDRRRRQDLAGSERRGRAPDTPAGGARPGQRGSYSSNSRSARRRTRSR